MNPRLGYSAVCHLFSLWLAVFWVGLGLDGDDRGGGIGRRYCCQFLCPVDSRIYSKRKKNVAFMWSMFVDVADRNDNPHLPNSSPPHKHQH